jgi:hypothetical protein
MDDLNHAGLNLPDDSDSAVRQWSQGKTFHQDELRRLSAEICRRARDEAAPFQLQSRSRFRLASISALALSVAAAAVLAFVFLRPVPGNSDADLLQAATLPIERMRVLARESGRLFDQRVAWLAETNQDLLLGLDETANSPDRNRQQISVRVVVFHRDSRSQAWQPVFTTNVVTREEEVIQMQNTAGGPSLRLWTHILPDQSVAVDTDLAMGGKTAPHWSTTSVVSEGPSAVLKAADGPGEYQVWQSAAIMEVEQAAVGKPEDKGL